MRYVKKDNKKITRKISSTTPFLFLLFMVLLASCVGGGGGGHGGGHGGHGGGGGVANALLDATFNSSGIVTTAVGTNSDQANALAIQPSDGKLVAAGFSAVGGVNNHEFALVRYNTDGSLDTSFGTTGTVTTSIGGLQDNANALAVQPSDGRLVAAGSSLIGASTVIALARYNTDGSLDTTFGTMGIVTTATGTIDDEAFALQVQPLDGKLVVAGFSNTGTDKVIALVRYNTDGSLDTTFGTTGKVTTAIGTTNDKAFALQIQSDGKLVVAGFSRTGTGTFVFALARYNTDGSLDTGFGTTGIVTTAVGSISDKAFALQIQADGRLVAAGLSFTGVYNVFALVRYNTDGTLDTGFGTMGIVTTAVGSSDDGAFALGIQPSDQKLIAAGYSSPQSFQSVIALARYNTDGTLDTSFNGTGMVTTSIDTDVQANALAIQSDGKPVAAGYALTGTGTFVFALARYAP